MQLQLKKATLIKRYKRFLADVILADGSQTTIHVANTGAMTGCAEPGDIVWYSTSSNTKRKYPFSWELTEKANGDVICVNTLRANQLVEEALQQKYISEFDHTEANAIQREVKYGSENSKIDFLLNAQPGSALNTYIEVKSVTLLQHRHNNVAKGYFPDSVTTRGQKHLRELIQLTQENAQAVLLFAVLHSGIHTVEAAAHIDATYANLLNQAIEQGVKVLVYKANFSFVRHAHEATVTIKLDSTAPLLTTPSLAKL